MEYNSNEFKYIDFKCEHCSQQYNNYSLNLAVFLYGIVLLIGKKVAYAGFTCPICLKTVLFKENDISKLWQDLSWFIGPKGSHWDISLTYHSSVIFTPNQIPALKDFDIRCWNNAFSDIEKQNFHAMLLDNIEEINSFNEDYLCSYDFNSDDVPMGVIASVWWFKAEQIDDIVKIENEHQIRIFPRYVHTMSFYEQLDQFCWENELYKDYHDSIKTSALAGYEKMRILAKEQDDNLDNLIEANPGVLTPEQVEDRFKYPENKDRNKVDNESTFLGILIDNPDPWDLPFETSRYYTNLWKTVSPFIDGTIPQNASDFDPEKYKPKMSNAEIEKISVEILDHKNKEYIQNWLSENYMTFIKDYISLAKRSDFSYGLVWDLKYNYLKQLYNHFKTEYRQEARFAIFEEVNSWTIIYDGKPIRALKGPGFKYIYFLLGRKRDEFNVFELKILDNMSLDQIRTFDYIVREERGYRIVGKGSETYNNDRILDDKAMISIKSRQRELKNEIEEAEKNNDTYKKEKKEKEYNLLFEEFKKALKKGKSKTFADDTIKTRKTIAKRIERTINAIAGRKQNKKSIFRDKVCKHFDTAFRPISLNKIAYTPDTDIEWFLG